MTRVPLSVCWLLLALVLASAGPAAAQLTITTPTPLPPWTVGVPYSQALAASGGVTPYIWSITAGALPTNLSLAPAGTISGTPNVTGTFNFTVQVTDSTIPTPLTATKALDLTINPAPAITTPSLPAWTILVAYPVTTLTATGGTGALSWGLAPGSLPLPTGLTLSAAGLLSGTPSATGTFNFTVRATDTVGGWGDKPFSVTINFAPTISTPSLPAWTVNIAYPATTLTATGGTGALSWGLAPASLPLPTGLTLSAAGLLSGTPSATGTFNFTVRATDTVGGWGDKPFSVTINPAPTIATTSLPSPWTVGAAYTAPALTASGGTGTYTWTLVATPGPWPPGLSVSAAGILSGTPSAAGTFNFTVRVTDTPGATGDKPFSITINPAPTITTTILPSPWPALLAYPNSTLTATGGTGALSWGLAPGSGPLPTGLTLTAAGLISGTPSTPGTFNFTVRVTDAVGGTGDQAFSVTINPSLTITTTSPLPPWTVGVPYSTVLVAINGSGALTWTSTGGALPTGLSLSAAGAITGTPTVTGPFSLIVQVTDSWGPPPQTTSKTFGLTINPTPSITTASLPAWTQGFAYTPITLTATGGTGALTFALAPGSGPPPTGLTLSGGGTISGTPVAAGTFGFTVRVTDAVGAIGDKPFSVTINPPLGISSLPPPSPWVVGVLYPATTFTASGGTGSYGWSLAPGSGPVPTGLTLNPGGILSGTPGAAGVFSFTLRVTDGVGATADAPYTVLINPPLTITTISPLPASTVGMPYSTTLAAAGGVLPYTWTPAGGSLPTGLTLSAAGAITGTPLATGTFNFTAQVTDSSTPTPLSASKSFDLTINPALSITTASLASPWTAGVVYPTTTLTASGGTGSLSWGLAPGSGPLPTGLSVSAAGAISGTPVATGTFNFTIRVTDSVGATGDKPLSIIINPAPTITTATVPSPWAVGLAYPSTTLAATGGTGAYGWALAPGSGPTPTGLTLSPTGTISGTPTAAGVFTFTVRVTDSVGGTGDKPFSITVNPALDITSTSPLASGTVGVAYSQTLVAVGGVPPYGWSISTGFLPGGLSLSPTGAITGTPTTPGSFTFFIQVADSVPETVTRPFTITIAAGLVVTTSSLPGGTVGVPYSQTLGAAGGTPPYSFAITAGVLPPGLTLNSSTGVISGTPTTNVGSPFGFTVQVTDSLAATATKPLSLSIAPALGITTASLPGGNVGLPYSQTLGASGGTPPYTFSLTAGSLPLGLALNPLTGVISGTPTTAGSSNFTVGVSDALAATATKALSITIAPPLAITTSSVLPAGTVGRSYSAGLAASGGTPPYSNWQVVAGSLPAGLALNASTGVIGGIPNAAGAFGFIVQVSDSVSVTTTKAFSLTVSAAVSITTTSLPTAVVGVVYSQTLSASGGSLPYTWFVLLGVLPPGITLNSSAGTLTGVATAAGTFTFTVQVTDSASAVATRELVLTVGTALAVTNTSPLPGGVLNSAYTTTLAAAGGTPPYTWTVTGGTLPPGLTLESSTGILRGTPTAAGSFAFSVTVTDSRSATATKELAISIGAVLAITTASPLTSGAVGTPYSLTLATTGGKTPYSWSLASGTLPSGLTLNPVSGFISGTPTAAGNFSFVLQVTDSAGLTASKAVTLTVTSGLSLLLASQLVDGSVGTVYSQTLAATGGTPPYTWAITSGQLPDGLKLDSSTGAISGTPAKAGSYTFTVQVTDSRGQTASQSLTLTVSAGFTISSETPLPAGALGTSYSYKLVASGGVPPYSEWTVTSGILPAGLSLDPATGVISGTPTQAGPFTFTVRARDSTGQTASKSFNLAVNPAALAIATASPLPNGTLGAAYSQGLQATGGTPPYSWSLSSGSLPEGLALDANQGRLSGTPTATGSATFTVQVTDNARRTSTKSFTLSIDPPRLPAVQISGPTSPADPAQQVAVRFSLAAAYPLPVTGQMTVTFDPDAVNSSDDPAVQFSSSGRTIRFQVPANSITADFDSPAALQTGTVAGTITLRATLQVDGRDLTPSPAPVLTLRVLRAAPTIRSVQLRRTASGFDVLVTGFSTPREVTQATFRFTAAAGANLQTSELTLPMTQLATTWFQGQQSTQFGSQFLLTQSFTVQGDQNAVASVSVVLTNSVGSSQATSAVF